MGSCNTTCEENCTCINIRAMNCSCSCTSKSCCDGEIASAVGSAVAIPLILEGILIAVIVGLVIWKRIKVAEFLYNLQLPKFRELPQWMMQKLRLTSRHSSPQPEVYTERTVHNPTYDMEEGNPSDSSAKAQEAGEPIELYEEVTETGLDNPGQGFDVYDIPECPYNDQLEPYATTDVFGGREMLDPYAITDVSQNAGQLGAYAVTDVPVGDLSNEKRRVVNAEVHVDSKQNNSQAAKPAIMQKPVQKDKGNSKVAVMLPTSKKPPLAAPAKQTNAQKETADLVKGRNASSAKPAVSKRSLSGSGTKDKLVSGAVKNIRVKFEDEDRRRSKSYTGVGWEEGARGDDSRNATSSGLSVMVKPKPLPKKKGILSKKIRDRGSSESGLDEYSKLDAKRQYASLEPHRGNETAEESRQNKLARDSYAHLKR